MNIISCDHNDMYSYSQPRGLNLESKIQKGQKKNIEGIRWNCEADTGTLVW